MTITQANLLCVPGMIWDTRQKVVEMLRRAAPSNPRAAHLARVQSLPALMRFELEGLASLESGEPIVSWMAQINALCDDRDADRWPVPARMPDIVDRIETRHDQAMFYWFNTERDLVHLDPGHAERSGMPASILHGACTASVACRSILRHVCAYDRQRIAELDLRWRAPVIPGETVETTLWIDGDLISFRCRSIERDEVVVDDGRCKLHDLFWPTEGNA